MKLWSYHKAIKWRWCTANEQIVWSLVGFLSLSLCRLSSLHHLRIDIENMRWCWWAVGAARTCIYQARHQCSRVKCMSPGRHRVNYTTHIHFMSNRNKCVCFFCILLWQRKVGRRDGEQNNNHRRCISHLFSFFFLFCCCFKCILHYLAKRRRVTVVTCSRKWSNNNEMHEHTHHILTHRWMMNIHEYILWVMISANGLWLVYWFYFCSTQNLLCAFPNCIYQLQMPRRCCHTRCLLTIWATFIACADTHFMHRFDGMTAARQT